MHTQRSLNVQRSDDRLFQSEKAAVIDNQNFSPDTTLSNGLGGLILTSMNPEKIDWEKEMDLLKEEFGL